MANVEKTKLGKIRCRTPKCGEPVYLHRHNGTGTLSYKCHECDLGWHAPKGSSAAIDALEELGPAPAPSPSPEPAPSPAPTPTPAPFMIGD